MRNFIISLIIMALLIGSWLFFDDYSQRELTGFAQAIEEDIIPAVRGGEWKTGEEYLDALSADWEEYKTAALVFLDTAAINEIDCSLARSREYVAAGDVSGATGELMVLVNLLTILHVQEDVNPGNIF